MGAAVSAHPPETTITARETKAYDTCGFIPNSLVDAIRVGSAWRAEPPPLSDASACLGRSIARGLSKLLKEEISVVRIAVFEYAIRKDEVNRCVWYRRETRFVYVIDTETTLSLQVLTQLIADEFRVIYKDHLAAPGEDMARVAPASRSQLQNHGLRRDAGEQMPRGIVERVALPLSVPDVIRIEA